MTVTASKETRVITSNTGFSNPIEIDQYVEQSSHLEVYADDELLSVGTHYTVDTALPADGVEITITATGLALAPTDWVVYHNPPVEQGADLNLGGNFGTPFEDALDALTRRVQTIRDIVNRSFRLSINTPLATEGGEVPTPVANNIFGWNSAGTALENKGTIAQFNTVADLETEITALAALTAQLTALGARTTEIDALYGKITEMVALYARVAAIDALYARTTDIDALGARTTEITALGARTAEIDALYLRVAELIALGARTTEIDALYARDTELGALGARTAEIDALYAEIASIAAKLNTSGSNVSDATTFLSNIGAMLPGQCQLVLDGGSLKLNRFDGKYVWCNGKPCIAPAVALSLAATGLTPGTLYYIYVSEASGALDALIASTDVPLLHTDGTMVRTGTTAQALVGMARPVTGPAWADSGAQRLVLSWFNRRKKIAVGGIAADTTGGTTYAAIGGTAAQAQLLSWGGEEVFILVSGRSYSSAAPQANYLSANLDGAEVGNDAFVELTTSGRWAAFPPIAHRAALTEGYHYATNSVKVGSGNGTYSITAYAEIMG